MNSFQKWFIVLRAYSWPASIVPILLSGVYSYKNGWFSWFDFSLIFIAGLSLHLGANVLNTYYDYVNGVDKEDSDDIGIVKNLVSKETAFKVAFALLSISAIIGFFIVFKYSLYNFLYIAAFGFLLSIFYTANPVSLKYKALGEIVIFLCFGPLIVSGSVMIMAKKFIYDSIWLSIPSAFLIVNILLANNIRDDNSDSERGIKTIVDLFGVEISKKIYIALLFLSYFISFFILSFSKTSLILLPLLILMYDLFKLIKKGDYTLLVRKTAQFVLVFGIFFSIAILGLTEKP